MEEYIVSARKYRPMSFDTVVGQAALTTTLKNAVKSGKLAHAYLFCGPRGVGKTTCARIFAKTINCMNPTAEGEACNECESCKAFNEQRSYNIFELDAASNNSVENIKSLMEQTRIAPQVGKYKVFIIDEVHMLSTAAFNAFLKTLEEPPAHVIFILATTEKHKILPTIISRCQIYDFERMTVPAIVNHLKSVARQEGIAVEDQALRMIAEKADGGMRDALSIFDQAAGFSQGNITYQKVLEDLNILDNEYYFQIVDLSINNKITDIMLLFNSILSKGFDGGLLINGLASHMRNVLMSKDAATTSLLEVSPQQQERYRQQAAKCPVSFLYKALKILNQCDINYRASSNKRLLAEITLIQVAQITQPDEDGASAGRSPRRLKSLFKKMVASQVKAARQVTAGTSASQQPKATPCETATPTPSEPQVASPVSDVRPKPRISLNRIGETFDVLLHGEPQKPVARPVEEIPDESPAANKAFTIEEVAREWMLMCNRMPQQLTGLAMRMKNILPQMTEFPHVEVVIENEILYGQILPIKGRIEKTLQSALHNTDIRLELRIAALEEIKRMPTKRELLEEMRKENSAIFKLCEALDLQMA